LATLRSQPLSYGRELVDHQRIELCWRDLARIAAAPAAMARKFENENRCSGRRHHAAGA
jgi:hypothetical protein